LGVDVDEQNVIGHLLDVEKQAADLLSDARNEVDKRKTTAREKADSDYRAAYATIIASLDENYEKERKVCDDERDREYASFSAHLDSLPRNQAAFNSWLDSLFFGA
jgi:vacuolar-type H+-ATPase subunit H